MRILLATFMLAPAPLFAQTPTVPETPYHDGILSLGAKEGSAPLSDGEKFRIHLNRAVKPRVFIFNLLGAGIQQWQNSPGGWGRGWDGFGKRYGSDLAITGMREGFSAVADSVAHQDPRFFRSEASGAGRRLKDALMQTLVAHTDSGGRAFSYGHVLGAYGSAGIAATWYPPRQRDVGDALISGTLQLAGIAGRNVAREFWPDVRRKLRHK